MSVSYHCRWLYVPVVVQRLQRPSMVGPPQVLRSHLMILLVNLWQIHLRLRPFIVLRFDLQSRIECILCVLTDK